MAILVTGGTGFIGAEVVRQLVAEGRHEVTVFHVSASHRRLADLKDQIHLVRGDLGNFSHILDVVQQSQPEAIYHLGAMLSTASDLDPAAAMQANVNGTFNILEAARIMRVPQVLFASSIGTYGLDMTGEAIDDLTLQRPLSFYGTAKLFGEGTGNFYRHRFGLDFRGIRFPGICGPGVRTPGAAQFHSWVVEECAKGRPYTIEVAPHTRVPLVYVKDAARGVLQLSRTPREQLVQFNYLINGVPPTPTAEELAELVRERVPGATIEFAVDPQRQAFIDRIIKPIDDRFARTEWGWNPAFDTAAMLDDFLADLASHPERYPD
ncbi:MAG: NAD-dependent epimerase/dehydratase family protein [Pseudomonadota bacterium]|nr:NAD-dependent epimerase/dehydratase family protein [Pseudomonadota bacterium]